jgi:hypothetical protein
MGNFFYLLRYFLFIYESHLCFWTSGGSFTSVANPIAWRNLTTYQVMSICHHSRPCLAEYQKYVKNWPSTTALESSWCPFLDEVLCAVVNAVIWLCSTFFLFFFPPWKTRCLIFFFNIILLFLFNFLIYFSCFWLFDFYLISSIKFEFIFGFIMY